MTINILLIVFGFLMGYMITNEWIVTPLRKKIEHKEKEYKDTLQESLDLTNK